MTLTLVILDNRENFLQFLDPELCTLQETIEYGGLRTLKLTYQFQDRVEDKELFTIGNKLWIQGDTNLSDCLYVINTEVKQDIYQENSFELELEEVLVELNYGPLFPQTELTTAVDDDDNPIFNIVTTHGKQEVVVDWNALNWWFGSYYNIGVIQKCISEYASRISITGTVNRMNLLRQIEEETGNIFVTRYEKDVLDNTIHRYLDFLNPINVNKDWQLNLQYDFVDITNVSIAYDEDGNIVTQDKDWEITRFENDHIAPESRTEDVDPPADEDDYDEEVDEPYDAESNEMYDYEESPDYTPVTSINPENCDFRITDGQHLLNTDGKIYHNDGDTPLKWNCDDIGLTGEDPSYFISINKVADEISVDINETSYAISGIGVNANPFLDALRELDYDEHIEMVNDIELSESKLPDGSYFEIYDYVSNKTLYRTLLNTEIGKVHEEVLDFGFNLENIVFNVDETDTYSGVSPVIQPNSNSGNGSDLSRTDIDTLINDWIDLEISKGEVVPMIVEKVNQTGTSPSNAASNFGTYSTSGNYFSRPLKPNDNLDNTPGTYEFYRATAYWKAPYTKYSGDLYVATEKTQNMQYTEIYNRPDTRNERQCFDSPKLGNTETSDEDVYAIYNQVALYLKEHEEPEIDIELDVANLRGYEYNNYDIHDKIYIKLPNTGELITTRVTKTTKEAHDVAKNSIEITNYRNVNTIKTITHETYIDASNVQYDYPNSKNLTARLVNTSPDTDTDEYPAIKLLTFTVYKTDGGFTGQTYTKLTDANGYATIPLKFDPGDYNIEIAFAGDEEYEESSLTIAMNVGGTLPQPTESTKTDTKQKTTKKNKKKVKTKKVKRYWTKCGLSPKDKKGNRNKIVSIAQPSSADAGKYSYSTLWKTVFKNYCPECGRSGYLRFDGGSKNACITSSTYGVNYKPSVPEHEITCIHCDSDYCGVTGQEKSYGHSSRLKTIESPKKSSKAEFNKLVTGKLLFDTKEVKVSSKKVVNNKQRKIRKKDIAQSVKQKALAIVGNKTGRAALMAIVAWDDNNIHYSGYPNFQHSAASVLSSHSGNCCDQTRLFFELCDAAGLCEYYNFFYVHVTGHVYGIVESKKTKKWSYVDPASDYHGCWGYVCQGYSHGGRTSKYPRLPF